MAAILVLGSEFSCGPSGEEVWYGTLGAGAPQFTPQWTPDGERIVFALGHPVHARRYIEAGSTFVASADGSNLGPISENVGKKYEVDFSPDISPDGSRIVYTTTRHKAEDPAAERAARRTLFRNFEIETAGLDGSDRRQLTRSGLQDLSPVWSPDGTRIAFVREDRFRFDGMEGHVEHGSIHYIGPEYGERGIYTMAADGSDLRLLFATHSVKAGPVWSPDGTKLAFVLRELDQERGAHYRQDRLYVVDAGGSAPVRLYTTLDGRFDRLPGAPAWSPDGSELAFAHYDPYSLGVEDKDRESSNALGGMLLYSIGPDGSGLRQMARSSIRAETLNLAWSPDGMGILLSTPGPSDWLEDSRGPLQRGSVQLVRADGSGLYTLAQGAYASWSPDGSRIALVERHQGFTREGRYAGPVGRFVFTVAPDGSDIRVLVTIDEEGELSAAGGQ